MSKVLVNSLMLMLIFILPALADSGIASQYGFDIGAGARPCTFAVLPNIGWIGINRFDSSGHPDLSFSNADTVLFMSALQGKTIYFNIGGSACGLPSVNWISF